MDQLTIGVEEEFLVVSLETGELVPRCRELLATLAGPVQDEVDSELNLCQIEVATPPSTSVDDIEAHLLRLRRSLLDAGARTGLGAVALSTHPYSSWEEQRIDLSSPRFREMHDEYRVVAREQVIAGCHIHLGIESADDRIVAMTNLRPWLPVLLAVTTNSPYWNGVDTGYASYRNQVWQRWPTARMPPGLTGWDEYEEMVGQLRESDAIADPTHLYWWARPSPRYPTLEIRVSDVCPSAQEAAALAALARALTVRCLEDPRAGQLAGVSNEVLEPALWRAARYGLTDELIDPFDGEPAPAADVVETTLRFAAPALEGAGDVERVRDAMATLLAGDTGAHRQRHAVATSGSRRAVIDAALSTTGGAPTT